MSSRLLIPLLLAALAPAGLRAGAFEELAADPVSFSAALSPAPEPALEEKDVEQWLPADNSNPGYEWVSRTRNQDEFVAIGRTDSYLKSGPGDAAGLADGTGRCALPAGTRLQLSAAPGFLGQHMTVALKEPLPGCSLTSGFVYIPHIASSSAGGFFELPRNVKAFLDTLAFAEGTREHYNFMFTFVAFESFADHPRRRICAGKLCSTAAGRYQFLSRTWDPLAADLGLRDFTPPNQEKAALEIIRRAGAYNNVARSSDFNQFSAALGKLNTIWASLPGSPYGQPTHPTAELWRYFKGRLALY